jgi:cytidylate kinase
MAVVTISSEIGSGASDLGQALAQRLAYRFVDREVISEAARRYGLAEAKLAGLDERKPSLFQRFDTETRRYVVGTQAALCSFALEDDVVLMGRGGQWLLRGIPHVLRVRVTAPFEVRVQRLTEQGRQSLRTVTELVRQDDAGRAGRTRYLYGIEIDNPTLYDVIINTATLSIETAVDLVATAIAQPELATTDVGRALMKDRMLATRVEVELATNPRTRKTTLKVDAQDGLVTLEGTGDLSHAERVARTIVGVTAVKLRAPEKPAASPPSS